jgi:hypothetical protein
LRNCTERKTTEIPKRAARVLTGVSYDTNSSELLELLNWKNIENRFRFKKVVLVYNILNNGTAPCLREFFLHEAIMILTIISEIMIQIFHFQNLRKNFLKEALGIVELYCGIVCSFNLLFQKTYLNLVFNCYSICNYTLCSG